VSTEETPLRLAIRAREGWTVCQRKKEPPPSHVSSEGGLGWSGCVERVPLGLASRAGEELKVADARTR
jgi:hypothetical protein